MHNDFLYENAWVAQLSSAGSELGWEGIIEMSAPFDGNISLSAKPFACANLLRLSVYYPAVHFTGTVQDLSGFKLIRLVIRGSQPITYSTPRS